MQDTDFLAKWGFGAGLGITRFLFVVHVESQIQGVDSKVEIARKWQKEK